MFDKFFNFICFRHWRIKLLQQKLIKAMKPDMAEHFLSTVLKLMELVLFVDKKFRNNINNFTGRYLFKTKEDGIVVSALFANNKLKVAEKTIDNPHITITFKDHVALMNYLLTENPDVLGSMLKQEVSVDGNLNYLYKFAYMARHLQLTATGKI